MIDLGAHEVHLWWTFPDGVRDPEILKRHLAILSADEKERRGRFVFERDRHRFLVSHALVRESLSRYAPVAPAEWRFQVNEYGRPSIDWPESQRWLRFNLSHSEGRAVVAIAREIEIGVDVEATRLQNDLAVIASQFFSPREVARLGDEPNAFFDFWTLKEAYIKARGMGLAIPLDSFSFLLSDPANPRIEFHEGCADQPGRWRFFLRRGDGYRVALAGATSEPLRVIEKVDGRD